MGLTVCKEAQGLVRTLSFTRTSTTLPLGCGPQVRYIGLTEEEKDLPTPEASRALSGEVNYH